MTIVLWLPAYCEHRARAAASGAIAARDRLLPPPLPSGAKRLKAKLALNVPTSDLISVLSADAELPWLAHLL